MLKFMALLSTSGKCIDKTFAHPSYIEIGNSQVPGKLGKVTYDHDKLTFWMDGEVMYFFIQSLRISRKSEICNLLSIGNQCKNTHYIQKQIVGCHLEFAHLQHD